MGEPLRIGVLGASRIAPTAVITPARELGHEVVAVAARSSGRARLYADHFGIPTVHGDYAELLANPDVEVVYNSLPNGLHGPWNLAALAAGKHVLTEKPFASNAVEALAVRAAARGGPLVVEGFHYLYHPVFQRVASLVSSGALGVVEEVATRLVMPAPAPEDPRWSLALAGGAMMDLGCYGLHVMRTLGRFLGAPTLVGAVAEARSPGVDAAMRVALAFPSGAVGSVECSMVEPVGEFSLTVTGSDGSVVAHNVLQPAFDDRVTFNGEVERLGKRSTYTYQLEALAAHLRDGVALPVDADDAVANMEMVDACYRAAGWEPRPSS